MDRQKLDMHIKNYINGQIYEFDIIYEETKKYVYLSIYSYVKNQMVIEDLMQDTYMKAIDNIQKYQLGTNFYAWISTIARNIAINRYNYNGAEKRNQNLTVALTELEDYLPSGDFAKDSVDKLAFSRALNNFLRSVPEKKRNMFIMRYWYFTEVKDIAEKMGVSENNVKVTLLRMREGLKKYLEKEGIRV